MPNSKIIWDSKALEQFSKIVKYIAKDSLLQAENVKTGIIKKIDSLANSPAMYAPDKYKENNNGGYRAFELHRLRIAYHVSGNEIEYCGLEAPTRSLCNINMKTIKYNLAE